MKPPPAKSPTLDAESAEVPPHQTTTPIRRLTPMPPPGAEVLGNIKHALSLSNGALL